jgi:hypothetical protein
MTGELAASAISEDSIGENVRTLQKPFRISELATLLTEVLASSRSPQPIKTA